MVPGGVAAAAVGSIVTPLGFGCGCVWGEVSGGGRLVLRRGGGDWSVGVHGLGCAPRMSPGGGAFVSGFCP